MTLWIKSTKSLRTFCIGFLECNTRYFFFYPDNMINNIFSPAKKKSIIIIITIDLKQPILHQDMVENSLT